MTNRPINNDESDRLDARITALASKLEDSITAAAEKVRDGRMLSEDECRLVRSEIKAKADRSVFRKAVIEKSFIGFVVFVASVIATMAWAVLKEWFINHGYKP